MRSCNKRLASSEATSSSSSKSETAKLGVRNIRYGEDESQAGREYRLVASGTGTGTGAEPSGSLRNKDERRPDPREIMSRVEMLARFLCKVSTLSVKSQQCDVR